jgi:integral membrane protein (TIGR00529 family)
MPLRSLISLDAISVTLFSIITLVVLLSIRLPLYIILVVVPLASSLLYGGGSFLSVVVKKTLLSGSTWGLVLNVFSVSWLVSLYSSLLIVDRLGKELSKALKSNFLTLTIVPGVIGLLPVAGGALMSAPIVDSVGEQAGLSKLKRNIVNMWYRHIFVYIYPLSPVIILTSSLFNINMARLILDQLPLAALMFVLGLPIVGLKWSASKGSSNVKLLLKDLSPIITAVFLSFTLTPIDKHVPIDRLSMTIAVIIGAIVFILVEKAPLSVIKSSFKDKRIWELSLISLEVMLYRFMFTLMNLEPLIDLMNRSSIPGSLVVLSLTVLFSFVSGAPTAGIAIAAPMIQSIIGITRGVADLAYASSFIGYLGSPLHLCYVYSSQYFKTSLTDGYKYLVPLTGASLLLALLMYGFVWS